ncbi:MAG: M14 family metallopeptidase [Planctomycetota bacterium]
MPTPRPRFRFCSALLLLAAAAVAQVPDPVEFFGHEVGADRKLIGYTELSRYFHTVAETSERVRIVDIGETSYGQRSVMAVISSPKNLANLERLRQIAIAMAHGEVDAETAAAMEREGRAFVWIDAGLHATETIAGQNIIELLWRMASRGDEETLRILDEVVVLACPVNPDGYELVANTYRATEAVGSPVLYQRYVGHDNNRDFYACNQKETQNTSRVFYRDWCPQIVYNHHQTAPRGTIIFTPPFRDPFNYHVDPLVVRGIEIVAAHMNERFALEGKPGVISRSGAPYSGWWNGGLRSTAYFHNIIGILTESFGRPEPTEVKQTLDRRLPIHDYPDPLPTQVWHARQTVEYLQTANFAILDYAARHRRELLRGIWTMATRAIQHGREDHWTPSPKMVAESKRRGDDSVWTDAEWRDPRAFVLPADQPDWSAAMRFARSLWHCGVQLQRATKAFEVAGRTVPAGSLVVQCDQCYRAHVLDMFEPQWHPDDLRDGKPVPPYDAAGWTLALQHDLQVIRCLDALEGPFEAIAELPAFDAVPVPQTSAGWRLDPRDSHALLAVNHLQQKGCVVQWTGDGYFVPVTPQASVVVKELARDFGVKAVSSAVAPTTATKVPPVRLGLFDVYGGHMPTGQARWLLEQFGFPVQTVWGQRIEAGDLRRDFDVLVFFTGLPGPRDLDRAIERRATVDLDALRDALPPFEDWSDLEARKVALTGENALPALRQFVEQGGTLIAMCGGGRESEVEKVIRHFELPVKVGTHVPSDDGEEGAGGERRTTQDEFYVPGSLLAIDVDVTHRLARGASAQLAAMVNRSSRVLEVTQPSADVDVVASYRAADPLLSGWAIGTEHLAGKAAVLCARVGRGRVVLFGIDATYRAQPLGTARLFFQAIATAGEQG